MKYRRIGSTGIVVSELGFGASPIGGVFGPVDEADAVNAVHAALDLGVTYFDTSPYYGSTQSEEVLGRALSGIERDRYVLSTKVGRYGETAFDFSVARVKESLQESAQRLGVETFDIVFCQDIEFSEFDQIVQETLPELERLKSEGLLRAIGVSALPLDVLRTAAGIASVDVVLSYCHYNIYNTSLGELVPDLQEKGVGLVSAAPFAMGLLTQDGPPTWHPASLPLRTACEDARHWCKAEGNSISRLALEFALALSGTATTLAGMVDIREVEQNCSVVETNKASPELSGLRRLLEPVQGDTWVSPSTFVQKLPKQS